LGRIIMDKGNSGRKLFDGKDKYSVLQKLEEAFILGATDGEACLYADISTSALYAYQKRNPAFLERKELLKLKPVLRARRTVVKALETNPDLALKYLERKMRIEFSTGQRVQIGLDKHVLSDEDKDHLDIILQSNS